jgi:hypothetical protein
MKTGAPQPTADPLAAAAADVPDDDRRHLVEAPTPLSSSQLWRLQRAYFERAGIDAWRHNTVPHYVTNNPALADAYAAVVLGWLRDGLRHRPGSAAPSNILELGAGSGRFSFYLLRALAALRALAPLAVPPYRYIMSDVAPANLAFWRDHEALAPFVADGTLEFALFDVEQDATVQLERSGITMQPGGHNTPLLVIANYVLDSIPQDAFTFSHGTLMERRIALASQSPLDPQGPDTLSTRAWTFSDYPAAAPPYPEPEFCALLASYQALCGDSAVLFPIAALRGLRRLAALAGGAMTLLSADRGSIHTPTYLAEDGADLLSHGSVSLPVNYHAIAAAARATGGRVLTPEGRHHSIAIMVSLPAPGDDFPETRLAFFQAIERGGPDEFFTLRRGLAPNYGALDARHLLALLRMSRWDPKILGDCALVLISTVRTLDAGLREAIADAVRLCCANHYRLELDHEWSRAIAALLFALGARAEALGLLEQVRLDNEGDARLHWDIGLCQAALGRTNEAASHFASAIHLDPDVMLNESLLR